MTEEEAFMRAFCVGRKARGVSGAASSHCGKMETAGQRSNKKETQRSRDPGKNIPFPLVFSVPLIAF